MNRPAPRILLRFASLTFLFVLSVPAAHAASPSDGTWYPVPTVSQPTIGEREEHTMVYDPVRQRFLAFGGVAHYWPGYLNDVWERPLNATGDWTPLTVTGTLPPGRRSHTAIYDSVGDRMIIFGGNSGSDRNDVWELTLGGIPHWNQLLPTGSAPSPRSEHTAVFDASRDRMVVYGGEGVPASDTTKTWFLDLTTSPPAWQSAVVPGTNPTWRAWQSAIFDPVRDRMVMIGGGGPRSPFPRFDEVWTLSFSPSPAWTRQGGNPAGNRLHASSAWDSAHDRMIVTCGNGAGSSLLNDVVFLDLASFAWTSGAPAESPDVRYAQSFAFDPATQTGLLQGGFQGGLPASFTDTWALTFTPSATWTNVVPNADPSPVGAYRFGAAGAFDSARNRFLMTCGQFNAGHAWIKDDILALEVGTDSAWVRIGTAQHDGYPYPRLGHSATYDPGRDRVLVYGGYNGVVSYYQDVYEIRLSPTITYAGLDMTGTPDLGRAYHAACFDPYRNRIVVFGGLRGTPRNDVVVIDSLASVFANKFTDMPITGTPPSARYFAGSVYDPWADRMLVFGGFDGTVSMNDLWSLSFNGASATWTQLTPAGTPPSVRHGATMALDPNRQRVLVYGGRNQASNSEATDVWQLTLGAQPLAWSQLAPAGTIPPARYNHVGIFDPIHDQLLVSGGLSQTAGILKDIWRLQFGTATTAVGIPDGSELSLTGFSPNPATRDARVAFSLIDRTPATIEVVDVGGRRVAQQRIDSPTAGARTVAIAPRGGFAPGIYFIRLTQGTRMRTARGVVVR